MKAYQNKLFGLLLIVVMTACGESKPTAANSAAEPTASQEREALPTPRPAPSRLEEEVDVPSSDDTESVIATIRKQYAAITARIEQEVLRIDTMQFECENDPGGGILTRYYDGEELVMLQLSIGGEHWWESDRIYFSEGEPFFVFREEESWRFDGPLNEEAPNSVDEITEERLYLKGATIIRALTKSYEIKSWEEELGPDDVPNQPLSELVGKEYPKMSTVAQMVIGNVGC